MKKGKRIFLLSALLLAVLAGCAKGEDGEDRKALVGQAVRMTEQQIADPEEKADGWYLLGRQFYRGEPVQIWSAKTVDGKLDIYLFHEDGSREELQQGAPAEYDAFRWFLDREDRRFLCSAARKEVICLNGQGEELYRRPGKSIRDICQLSDGRIMVLRAEEGSLRLGELHGDTGIVDDIDTVDLGKNVLQFIGAGESGLLMLDADGLWEINLKDGDRECVMAFDAAYDPGGSVEDFRVPEDGRLEVLQSGGKLQKLELYDPVGDREVVIVRSSSFNSDMEQRALAFNQTDEEYYIYLEACPEGSNRLDFGERTLVEIAAGKGPDIICAPLLVEEAWDLVENGYLEDLAPRMSEAGIREEDYFPTAFAYLRDGDRIYGINNSVKAGTYYISSAVLGDRKDSDIGTLVDALAGYEGEGVFAGMSARRILQYFLEGSGDLWGMLDRETGSCSFDGELFAGMLYVAGRYADDGKDGRPVLFESGGNMNYYDCDYERQQHAEREMVEIGHFFDNGRHCEESNATWMAITSTSRYKEGAWAFLQFLLSDQAQMIGIRMDTSFYPTSKKAYEKMAGQAIEEGAYYFYTTDDGKPAGTTRAGHADFFRTLGMTAYEEMFDPTEEKVEQVRRALEDSQVPPLKTQPILNIICEEAEAYFSGAKSIEEVTPIIQNRVQLYLDERR